MSYTGRRLAVAVAALLFPVAAFSATSITMQYTTYNTSTGTSGTATLNPGQSLNLETGAVASSGGDLSWDGSNLTPVAKALAVNLTGLLSTYSGASGYASVSQALLQAGVVAGLGSSAPIAGLIVGNVIGAEDNSGNVAKLLVTALGTSTGGGAAPTITMVQNNYSYLVPGLPNYGIAPGALFIIKGTGMASATTVTSLQSSASPGIPTTLNGASISVTVNGVTTHPGMYYAEATQLAAVLPSGTPAGTGTITVSYNNAPSNSAAITVLTSALGLDTYFGTGSGLGVATDPTTGALFNYTNSVTPGKSIVLWGSGLGADTADSDTVFTTTPHSVSVPLTIYIGGVQAQVLYAGSSGYPGVNQINVTVPASVPTGCGVSVVAVSGSTSSNTVTLPVIAGGGVCSDPITGVTGTTISTLTGTTNYNSGALFVLQSTSQGQTEGIAEANFQNVQTTTSSTVSGITSLGSCTLTTSVAGSIPTSVISGLDAGTITLTGPASTAPLMASPVSAGEYIAQLASGFIPASGGSFTFKGTGGSQVGAFSVSVAYTSPLVWTNSSAITAVTRASGVNVTWTGGASGSYVYIGGSSSSSTASANFVCYAPASAGSFTVPSYVLLALPAGSGNLALENITTPVPFSASGLNYGAAFAGVGTSISPTYN